jgi:REP element-mobilizing transposase RayT
VLDDRDRSVFLDRFISTARAREWVVYTSCLLATHHHSVVETPHADLGDGMKRILGGYARWFNERHGTEGSLFVGRFWSRRITSAEQLLATCLYVDLNPVASGLCRHPLDWPWGAYSATNRDLEPSHVERLRSLPGADDIITLQYRELVDIGAAQLVARRAASGAETWDRIQNLLAQDPKRSSQMSV